ncbi:hypothetical protein AOQ84DRAFT_438786 [Glonium stellatum]|uniref:Uncharacterized protein n=1 Tax=Glonium stellatum TaxID=574774 RepID=A0A8E2F375_9PEZI|nr:hypothetical protein AOQ84DRAFT_438786 [Glonium stellatum]
MSGSLPYTDLQKDRQARNRPTHRAQPPGTTATKPADGAVHPNEYKTDESYEDRERRHQAALYLESNEMLIWFANQRNESVPQTRLHFEKILAGLDSDSDSLEWADDLEDDEDEDEEAEANPKNKKLMSPKTKSKGGKGERRKEGSKRKSSASGN